MNVFCNPWKYSDSLTSELFTCANGPSLAFYYLPSYDRTSFLIFSRSFLWGPSSAPPLFPFVSDLQRLVVQLRMAQGGATNYTCEWRGHQLSRYPQFCTESQLCLQILHRMCRYTGGNWIRGGHNPQIIEIAVAWTWSLAPSGYSWI